MACLNVFVQIRLQAHLHFPILHSTPLLCFAVSAILFLQNNNGPEHLFNLTQAGAWSEILIGWLTEFLKCKGVYDVVKGRRELSLPWLEVAHRTWGCKCGWLTRQCLMFEAICKPFWKHRPAWSKYRPAGHMWPVDRIFMAREHSHFCLLCGCYSREF